MTNVEKPTYKRFWPVKKILFSNMSHCFYSKFQLCEPNGASLEHVLQHLGCGFITCAMGLTLRSLLKLAAKKYLYKIDT